jgi:hypothetical protein
MFNPSKVNFYTKAAAGNLTKTGKLKGIYFVTKTKEGARSEGRISPAPIIRGSITLVEIKVRRLPAANTICMM